MGKITQPLTIVRQVDEQLWTFKQYKKELRELRDDVMFGSPVYENIGGGRSSFHSDSTALKATTMVSNRRIRYLELWINAIESVLEELPEEKIKLMNIRYFNNGRNCPSWEATADFLHVDRSTAIAWRNAICKTIAARVGLA
jgi:RinA family phage transcriptional activator